jgi:hypothetical protein
MMRLNRKSSKSKQPSKVRAAMVAFSVVGLLDCRSLFDFVLCKFHIPSSKENFVNSALELVQRTHYDGKTLIFRRVILCAGNVFSIHVDLYTPMYYFFGPAPSCWGLYLPIASHYARNFPVEICSSLDLSTFIVDSCF